MSEQHARQPPPGHIPDANSFAGTCDNEIATRRPGDRENLIACFVIDEQTPVGIRQFKPWRVDSAVEPIEVTRAGAQVTAPCDGWVVYAGPFRSYGQLLILNAGGGYHVLLAGMERISVDLGQFVLTGEPVAIMGGGPQSAAAVATGSSQPILYIEFRKDGVPVDPSPWWAANDSEKVRG